MSLRNARLLQVLGLLIALAGLAGFWLTRDVEKAELTPVQRQILGVSPEEEDAFRASFVVAGRDYDYSRDASPCRWVGGECIRERTGEKILGDRTDTIIYVSVLGNTITMINLPRDIYLPQWQTRINEMYHYQGAEGLVESVEAILGLPVDYYAIINIDIFKELVDALGGVNVNVPYRMYKRDAAAGLLIDLEEGPQHLSGEEAAGFIRYRDTLRGDIDRIDNVKRLAYAMLARLKELNVRAALKVPELTGVFFSNIETNASPALVRSLLPHVSQLQIEAATLPTCCERRIPIHGDIFEVDPAVVETFLAETFGGEARVFTEAPELTLLITNRSGEGGLEARYRARLVAMGVPEERILTREASDDPSPTRLLTTTRHWQDADYYTSLLHTSKQQIDRFAEVDGTKIDLELVLGEDAGRSSLAQGLQVDTWAQSELQAIGNEVTSSPAPQPFPKNSN